MINNKKGFTLIELLAVILLLAIIIVFVVPNVVKIFNSSNSKLNGLQKKQLEEAVELYINDTCLNPISDLYVCEFASTIDSGSNIIISNSSISLDDFLAKGYISSDSQLSKCSGTIFIIENKVDTNSVNCSS